MRILAVLSHPNRASFTGAMLDAFVDGAEGAGHEVDVADLHRMAFDFAFQAGDAAQFGGAPMPDAVVAEQARIERADAIAFFYPVYWWTFPALLRGWIDRVLSFGWAYRFSDSPDKGLLADRPVHLFAMCGASRATFEDFGYRPAMERLIDEGTFRYCGLKDVRDHYVFDVHDSAEQRAAGLHDARSAGSRPAA
jgi:NAD(P)H dehydrogenase (quinone)